MKIIKLILRKKKNLKEKPDKGVRPILGISRHASFVEIVWNRAKDFKHHQILDLCLFCVFFKAYKSPLNLSFTFKKISELWKN